MWKFLKEEYDYKRPKRGDIRYAEVLRIDEDEIIVDIGGKTEGVVPSVDLDRMGEEAVSEIEVGDKVPVYVLRPESADGDVIVSLNMAKTMEDWRRAEKLFEEGDVYEGTVSGHNKGGLLVYYGQIRGFVPASQLSGLSRRSGHEERMETLSRMEGRQLMLKVIEVDRQRRRLIFSERAASREWREMRKEELLDELQEGDIRSGTVRNLCDFGAFVDLGGADGLIHISELSWRRVKHARDVLKVGEEVEVYVLRVDRDRKRIGLSLKRLQPDPWHVIEEKYEVGQIVKGVITNIVDFGAFARIEDGIEGLIHVSELSDGDFAPQDLVREGETLYLKILSIDSSRQRMGLSLKQAPSREEIEGTEAWAELREEGEPGVEEPEPAPAEAEPGEPSEELAAEGEAEGEAELGEPAAEVVEEAEVVAEAELVEPSEELVAEEEAEGVVELEEPAAEVVEEEEVVAEAELVEPSEELVAEGEAEVEVELEEAAAEVVEEEEAVAEAELVEPSEELVAEEEAEGEVESEELAAEVVEEEEAVAEADFGEASEEVTEEEEAKAEVESEAPAAELVKEEETEAGKADLVLEPEASRREDEDDDEDDDEYDDDDDDDYDDDDDDDYDDEDDDDYDDEDDDDYDDEDEDW
jgi:small subunit ribosomal protein S1